MGSGAFPQMLKHRVTTCPSPTPGCTAKRVNAPVHTDVHMETHSRIVTTAKE